MYGLRPNTEISRLTPFGTDRHGLLINNQDQAGRDLSIPSDAHRIFVFGNSTILSTGSERSLAAYLETALNAEGGEKFEVVTAGADGFNSGQELARLALETLHFHPDMIITFDGVADAFWSSFADNPAPNAHINAQILKQTLEENSLQNKSFVEVNKSSVDFFLRRFYSYHVLLAVLSKIGLDVTSSVGIAGRTTIGNALADAPTFRPQGAQTYIGNLTSMAAISNLRGIRTLHFLQPTVATELLERGGRATEAEWDLHETTDAQAKFSRQQRAGIFQQFYTIARSEFARLGQNPGNDLQTWVDLSRFFSDVDDLTEVYRDAVHYHDYRNREIAVEVAGHVRRALASGRAD